MLIIIAISLILLFASPTTYSQEKVHSTETPLKSASGRFLELSYPIVLEAEADGVYIDRILDKYSESHTFREHLGVTGEEIEIMSKEYRLVTEAFEKERDELLLAWSASDSQGEKEKIEIKYVDSLKNNFIKKTNEITERLLSSEKRLKIYQMLFTEYYPLLNPIPVFRFYDSLDFDSDQQKKLVAIKSDAVETIAKYTLETFKLQSQLEKDEEIHALAMRIEQKRKEVERKLFVLMNKEQKSKRRVTRLKTTRILEKIREECKKTEDSLIIVP